MADYDKAKVQELLRMEGRFASMPAYEYIHELCEGLRAADVAMDGKVTDARTATNEVYDLRRTADEQRGEIKKLKEEQSVAQKNLALAVTTLTEIAGDARGAKPKALATLKDIGAPVPTSP
jgi:hypothetical protein